MLKLSNLSKTFNPGTVNEKKALSNVNLELAKGDFVTILGSHGAGKSTLFNAIAGFFSGGRGHHPPGRSKPSPTTRTTSAANTSGGCSRTR